MKKQIVIIDGTGGSGKDTFVSLCSKYVKTTNFSSVDKVKEVARLIGWDGGKTDKDRKFLSDLKKFTTDYCDMAFCDTKKHVQEFKNSSCQLMFIHIREPEEIKRAADAFGAKTLLIKRAGLNNITTNYSDANVDNYPYDFVIENSTLEELETRAKEFVTKIIK